MKTFDPKILKGNGPQTFTQFSSILDLQKYGRQLLKEGHSRLTERTKFYGDESFLTGLELATLPHDGLAKRAADVRRTFDDLVIQGFRRRRYYSKVGRPVVPRAIAGHPVAMSKVKKEKSNATPLTIVYDLTSSAAIENNVITELGIYTCALVALLSERRPVDLHLFSAGMPSSYSPKFSGWSVRLDTNPLDIPRTVWLMSSPGFSRAVGHQLIRILGTGQNEGGIRWPWDDGNWYKREELLSFMKTNYGSDVLFIGPKVAGEEHFDMFSVDPEQWVRHMVREWSDK